MSKIHTYTTNLSWIGNQGKGTLNYSAYSRNHIIEGIQKSTSINCSSDPNFRGDTQRYNPEELLLSSLSSCHMLWYLHLCSVNNITVEAYTDEAKGTMEETTDGSGKFTQVVLYPNVTVTHSNMIEKAMALHHEANKMCFIANSCNFQILHEPIIHVTSE